MTQHRAVRQVAFILVRKFFAGHFVYRFFLLVVYLKCRGTLFNEILAGHVMKPPFSQPFALSMGPQQCGVDWVEGYFKARRDICLPDVKETCFFDRHYDRGESFYFSHFLPQTSHIYVAELTTTVFDVPDAPARVRATLGDHVKLLCLLRHPVERAYAAYRDFARYGIVSGPIDEAVDQAPQILHSSRYADHLSRWFQVFDRKQVKTLFYEDLVRDPGHYAGELCAAMGIAYSQPAAEKQGIFAALAKLINGNTKTPLEEQERHWLGLRLGSEISNLEKVLGHSVPQWRPNN
jgi:hypothetical protein